MTHPLLYDVKRTFMSKSVLISMILLIAISLVLISSFTVSSTGPQFNSANTQILSWYDRSGTYHFIGFATNQFGQPVSGVTFQLNLTLYSASYISNAGPITSTPTTSPIYKGPSVTTNSSGIVQFSINAPISTNYSTFISTSQQNGFSGLTGGYNRPYLVFSNLPNGTGIMEPLAPGQIVSVLGNFPINTVTDTKNSQASDIQALWSGVNGSEPIGYSLYYSFINETQACSTSQNGGVSCTLTTSFPGKQSLNETSMQFLGNMTSFNTVFSPPKLERNLSSSAQLELGFFFPNGTALADGPMVFPVQNLYPQPQIFTESGINRIVLNFFLGIFGTFIPLIAILGSYNSYGKDRVSGVLESVLAQPVSRRGLSMSRFFSTFIALSIAISISMIVVDAIVWYFAKTLVSSTIMLSSAGAFFVELAAFTGIMMLLSTFLKSPGALIGIGIGLFLVIDFFWSFIMLLALIFSSGANPGSLTYYGYLIGGEFLNPAQFVGLVDTYITHQASTVGIGGFGFGFQISPEQYGLTIPSIVVTGILWVIIPLAGFLYFAIRKD